ncbi:DUF4886 domain-containing protein [Hymenobacter rubidus]|uniref:DUF4886 domain-containing protein n=1 Tax=Hymenobacter rubidus TaxID=1441626 RepID=UPI00191D2CB0|nr:DUF4886 domain-containing protein [Hymenobacter rubidus]
MLFPKSLALAALSALPLAPAGAQAPAPNAILFVGNSFFHGKYPPVLNYNAENVKDENFGLPKEDPRFENHPEEPGPWGGIPGIFKKLTDEAGLNYEVHIESISGKTLKFHYDNVLPLIQQPRWNTVVLQENSAYVLPTRRTGHPEVFREYAAKLEQAVHTANPAARLYLYQTWARADMHYTPKGAYAGLPVDSMTADLHAAYYGVLQQDPKFSGVAPAGDAWLRAIEAGVATRNPYTPEAGKINLWGPDYYHPSKWGCYLNACVLLAEITGKDPRTLGAGEQAAAALGIAPAEAVSLQRIAYEQVRTARPTAFSDKAAGGNAAPGKVKIKTKTRKG